MFFDCRAQGSASLFEAHGSGYAYPSFEGAATVLMPSQGGSKRLGQVGRRAKGALRAMPGAPHVSARLAFSGCCGLGLSLASPFPLVGILPGPPGAGFPSASSLRVLAVCDGPAAFRPWLARVCVAPFLLPRHGSRFCAVRVCALLSSRGLIPPLSPSLPLLSRR